MKFVFRKYTQYDILNTTFTMCGARRCSILHFVLMLMMRCNPSSSDSCRPKQLIRIPSLRYDTLFTSNHNYVISATPLECVYFCLTSHGSAITAVYDEGQCVCLNFAMKHTNGGEGMREVLSVPLRKGKEHIGVWDY